MLLNYVQQNRSIVHSLIMSNQTKEIVDIPKTVETSDDPTNSPMVSSIIRKRGRPKKVIDESEAKLIDEKLRALREQRAKLKQEKISKKGKKIGKNDRETKTIDSCCAPSDALSRLVENETFGSFEEVEQWVQELSDQNFYPLRVFDSCSVQAYNLRIKKKIPESVQYKYVKFACSHYGDPRDRTT